MNDKPRQSFTVVFEGDVSNLGFNPLMADTAFGKVKAVAMGDLVEDCAGLRELLDDAREQLNDPFLHTT
jgi:hypothetical protein